MRAPGLDALEAIMMSIGSLATDSERIVVPFCDIIREYDSRMNEEPPEANGRCVEIPRRKYSQAIAE
jgi:hypothetical protein